MRVLPLHRKELIRKLKELGYNGPYVGGNHEYLKQNNFRIIIPNTHSGKDIPVPIIKAIIKQLGIDEKIWKNL